VRLTPRFVVALGLLVTFTTTGLGVVLREQQREREASRFDAEVASACRRVVAEARRQAAADRRMLRGACASGELVDRTLVALEAGTLDSRRVALAALIPDQRRALDLDELMLVTAKGELLGVDPRELLATSRREVLDWALGTEDRFLTDAQAKTVFAAKPSAVARCKRGSGDTAVALVGARRLDPLFARIGATLDVSVARGSEPTTDPLRAQATCAIDDPNMRVAIVVTKDKAALIAALAAIDQTVAVSALGSLAFALLLAVILARGLSRPISELARQAAKVASGDAQPIGASGSGEIADLGRSFDRMLIDLAATRSKLAATSRVAAWREVARRVAHEIKNPLVPIRAAVETLRRLRARDDPAFDLYFDEATKTVLGEVHRITSIVTEFTRFARLPPPRPVSVNLAELCREVAQLHQAAAPKVRIAVEAPADLPHVRADRDQIVQVVTNLLQNATYAVTTGGGNHVVVQLSRHEVGVSITVVDDGAGVAPDMVPRLFEPYATNKEQGTGLGLAIAQRIAIEHGGELSYAPRTTRGSEFCLILSLGGPPPVSELTPPSQP
jgi:hypothetical protein